MGTQGMTPWVASPGGTGVGSDVYNNLFAQTNGGAPGGFGQNPGGFSPYSGQQGSTDPSVFTADPYIKGLNQNAYARQANQGLAPNFTQDQFNNAWSQYMQPGSGFNADAFNTAMGTGTPATGPGSSAGTGWTPTNFVMNPDGSFGQAPAQQPQNTGVGQLLTHPSQVTSVTDLIHNPLAGGGSATTQPLNSNVPAYNPVTTQPGGGAPQGQAPGGQPTVAGNPFANLGNPIQTTIQTPGQADATPGQAASGFPSAPDQALAANAPNIGYLQNIAANAGNPINQTPAWQAMVAAQQRQIQEGQANLDAQFDMSGGRFSTAYGTAAADYQNQAIANQNSLLAQMTAQAQENAANRNLSASGQLGNISQQSLGQLSAQDFQAEMLRMQQAYGAAQSLFGGGTQAASQLATQGNQGADLMAQLGAQGAMGLLGGSLQGAQGLFGAENLAGLTQVQQQLALQQMGLGAASNLSQLWDQNLQTGSQLGGQQYGTAQSQINNLYQEFLRTQPEYSPLLGQMGQGAYAYPQMYYPYFKPSQLGSILGGLGGLLGGGSSLIPLLAGLFGGGGGMNIPIDQVPATSP